MEFLDSNRHAYYPDDVMVLLIKEGCDSERCWARITGLGDGYFIATLLNEPYQEFGYHEGDTIAFFVSETEEKTYICCSYMNPSMVLTAEDLEDGSLLRKSISAFNSDRNEEYFIDVLELLRDSNVWIPCTAIPSEKDMKELERIIEHNVDVKGIELSLHDDVRMIPDILKKGDEFYFPVFITPEDMGEYGMSFSKVQKHFLEAIALARNNEKKLVV